MRYSSLYRHSLSVSLSLSLSFSRLLVVVAGLRGAQVVGRWVCVCVCACVCVCVCVRAPFPSHARPPHGLCVCVCPLATSPSAAPAGPGPCTAPMRWTPPAPRQPNDCLDRPACQPLSLLHHGNMDRVSESSDLARRRFDPKHGSVVARVVDYQSKRSEDAHITICSLVTLSEFTVSRFG